MFVLKMYVQIMSLSVLLCNVCVCYVYILKMSKKIKVKKKKKKNPRIYTHGPGLNNVTLRLSIFKPFNSENHGINITYHSILLKKTIYAMYKIPYISNKRTVLYWIWEASFSALVHRWRPKRRRRRGLYLCTSAEKEAFHIL